MVISELFFLFLVLGFYQFEICSTAIFLLFLKSCFSFAISESCDLPFWNYVVFYAISESCFFNMYSKHPISLNHNLTIIEHSQTKQQNIFNNESFIIWFNSFISISSTTKY